MSTKAENINGILFKYILCLGFTKVTRAATIMVM